MGLVVADSFCGNTQCLFAILHFQLIKIYNFITMFPRKRCAFQMKVQGSQIRTSNHRAYLLPRMMTSAVTVSYTEPENLHILAFSFGFE